MSLEITLDQWRAISEKARIAHEALRALDETLSGVHLDHIRDDQVARFMNAVDERLRDARYITQDLQIQTEWTGGDNDGLREPRALFIIGRIPHAIGRPI